MATQPVVERGAVTARLYELIIRAQILPGEKLNEAALAEQLSTSRTSVRNALRHLAMEGLVEQTPHKGSFVARADATEARYFFDFRSPLHIECVRLALPLVTTERLGRMRKELTNLEVALNEHRLFDCLGHIAEFNNVLYYACPNPFYADAMQDLEFRTKRYRTSIMRSGSRIGDTLSYLHRLFAAVSNRDEEVALRVIRERYEEALLTYLEDLRVSVLS